VTAKAPKKSFIKSTVTVHDRTQIETVFDYYLWRGSQSASRPRRLQYKVDVYLFYPRQFGIDPQSYPKERFYSDVRPLIRFREPRLSFKQMLGRRPSARSPLVSLRQYVERLQAGTLDGPVEQAIDEAQVFCCSYMGNVLRAIDRKKKRLSRIAVGDIPIRKVKDENGNKLPLPLETEAEATARVLKRAERLLVKMDMVVVEFRSILDTARRIEGEIAKPLVVEMEAIDEYLYYRLRDCVAQVLTIFRYAPQPAPEAAWEKLLEISRALLSAHEDYAEQAGYMRVDDASPDETKERYLHRRGELKRRIWQVLFLQIRTTPLFKFQQQIGAMIAAGIAAFWAVVTQIIIIRRYITHADPTDLFGITGIIFLIAAVFAYIVKDRIKEIGRSYFRGRVFGQLPDQSERIYYAERPVGHLRETTTFINAAKLPARIAEMRTRACSVAGEGEESLDGVLVYTKDIVLDPGLAILGRYRLKAVHDIVRLNIDAYLARLGEPRRSLNLVDLDGNVKAVTFPKVYYLDLALDYSRVGRSGARETQAVDYFRLVIDKSGLLRVERLL
jgi:hypothetical protein